MAAEAAPQKTVLVPIAKGSEEIETACITDTLVRAGAKVVVARAPVATDSPDNLLVEMSRGLRIQADCNIDKCVGQEFEAIILPGGMPGANHLRDNAQLKALLLEHMERRKVIAAVCASPAVVLAHHKLLEGREATCYPNPTFRDALAKECKQVREDAAAVVDGNVITGTGPGTSLLFALKIVEALYGAEKAEELRAAMQVGRPKKPVQLRKSKFGKVAKIKPEATGLNFLLQVVKCEETVAGKQWEAVLGDDSGVVTFSLRNKDHADLCKAGSSVRVQNARVLIVKGFIRLIVDKWAVMKAAEEPVEGEVNTGKDISAVEYQLT